MSIRKLTTCAICIALAVEASLIRIYQFPFGGSVTLFSMLIIVLPAWIYGWKEGVLCGLIYGMMQFILGPYIVSVPQVILDYVLAFSIMGVAGFFKDSKNGIIKGYAVAILGRWVIATLAGLAWVAAGSVAWDGWNPLPYSMAYNAAYIFTEAAVTFVVLAMPPMKKALNYIKQMAYKQ